MLKMVFENIENTVFVFFENCSCYFNLVFSMFFFITKKRKTNVFFHVFLIFFVFENKKQFLNFVTKIGLQLFSFFFFF